MMRLISLYDVEHILLDIISEEKDIVKKEDIVRAIDKMENLPSYEIDGTTIGNELIFNTVKK